MNDLTPEKTQVNNFRVRAAQSYPTNRLFCWHRKRNLRVLLASNGADIYCDRCGRKRFGYMFTPPGERP